MDVVSEWVCTATADREESSDLHQTLQVHWTTKHLTTEHARTTGIRQDGHADGARKSGQEVPGVQCVASPRRVRFSRDGWVGCGWMALVQECMVEENEEPEPFFSAWEILLLRLCGTKIAPLRMKGAAHGWALLNRSRLKEQSGGQEGGKPWVMNSHA